MARVLTVIWMLAGLIIQGLFVATVTMSLVSQSLDVDFKLYGNKVTRLKNSSCKGSQCVRGIRFFLLLSCRFCPSFHAAYQYEGGLLGKQH